MISINDYIDNIFFDFQEYVESSDCLCELHNLRFNGGHVPNYSCLPVLQLYLLRYAYAYAFEYKQMFKTLAPQTWVRKELVLTSIGCGTKLDYWGARQVLDDAGCSLPIRYTGIDLRDWQYKMPCASGDKADYFVEDAIKFLQGKKCWDDDVFIFPKSISEFSDQAFQDLCDVFGNANYKKSRFVVMASLRTDDVSRKMDVARVAKLTDAITETGFYTQSPCDKYWKAKEPDKMIRKVDPAFQHPSQVVEFITHLYEQCNRMDYCDKNQDECEKRLNWWPILRQRQLAFQVISFVRK